MPPLCHAARHLLEVCSVLKVCYLLDSLLVLSDRWLWAGRSEGQGALQLYGM